MKENRQEAQNHWQNTYLSAIYELDDLGIRIHPNEENPQLDKWIHKQGVKKWTFITAENPRSTLLPQRTNINRMAELRDMLREQGYRFIPGKGYAPDGKWPAESSLLVLGIEKKDAIELAKVFEQHAILYGEYHEASELLWCD